MPPADHLIERAAALLQGSAKALGDAKPLEAKALQPAAAQPGSPAAFAPQPDPAELDPPPASISFIPQPSGKPILVQPAAPAQPKPAPVAAPPALAKPSPATPDGAALPPDGYDHQPPIGYDHLQAGGMVVARGSRTRISEEYRIVLGRVLRAQRDEPEGAGIPNLLMVTSARPGEGKSFTALNLSGSIAQHTTERVLLVDLDAKVRPLTALLGADEGPGFYDLVANPALRPESVVRRTAIGNLSFIPVGRRAPELDGQVDTSPITATITRLAHQFSKHIIVLDAPPCLSTSDPSTIAPIVGQIVMVIEAERTQRNEVEAALELVRVCPTITMLLNKLRLTTSHTFGAYDYYGNYS